jgi:spore coat protein U-like protein
VTCALNGIKKSAPARKARFMVLAVRRHWTPARTSLTVCAIAVALWAGVAAAQGPPARCRFDVAPTSMIFTGYTPFGLGAAATSTIHYDCPPPVTSAWIAISAPRVMASGGNTLSFEAYQDPAHTSVWRDAPPTPVPATRNGSVTAYGFLPPQDAAPGAYATTLVVRIYSNAINVETDAANLAVQANVPASCIIDPATLAFGTYDPLAGTPLDAQAPIRIACTRTTPWTVGLGTGNNPLGAMRQMASAANRLQYQLYSDPARTAIWDAISTVGGTAASIAPVDLLVYGRVPSGQPAVAGPYQDVVQSTINF